MLLAQTASLPAALARARLGSRIATSIAMIATTTNTSMSENAERFILPPWPEGLIAGTDLPVQVIA
jgi:hypothetical protein